jgi:HipA-like protein
MSERLTVYFSGEVVGTIVSTESGQMQFEYSESWRLGR